MNVVITPAMVGQVVISGLLSGTLYAMVALGLALIFGVMRVINIAHGPMLMLGAYATFFLYSAFGVNPYLTLPVSMAALFVIGMLLERTLVFRVVDAPELSSLLLTFGISIAVVNLAQLAFTSDLRAVEFLTGSFVVGPFAVSKSRLVAFVFAAIISAAVFVFLRNTKLGKAIRATGSRPRWPPPAARSSPSSWRSSPRWARSGPSSRSSSSCSVAPGTIRAPSSAACSWASSSSSRRSS